MELGGKSVDEVLEDIMRIHRSLPPRPAIDDVEGARILIRNLEAEEQAKIEAIVRQKKRKDVPDELFNVLVEMQKCFVRFQSEEQKREAVKLLDLEHTHQVFDEMILRASSFCGDRNGQSGGSGSGLASASVSSYASPSTVSVVSKPVSSLYFEKEAVKASELVTRDDSYVSKSKSVFNGDVLKPKIVDSTLKPVITSGQDGSKLNFMKLASLIEVSSKKGTKDLNLRSKLMDQIEWLPDSIGKLSTLITLDLSENRLVTLPSSISGLSSLTKLDLHSNKIVELPESIGDLLSLIYLDLRANQLSTLPAGISRLVRLQELDLSSNNLSVLPESIGSLVNLQKLNIETNNIEEIPHIIGHCVSLKELLADYNKLKALPEAIGKLELLETLSVRYNNISRLPTTISSLTNIKELDLSFNELESMPESLCFATTLVKINISNNFADLRSLPRSIGNLENLEELDMSNNQIRVLPDSFRMLSKLQVLKTEGNLLEIPPRDVLDQGARAVVLFMNELHQKKDEKVQPVKKKKSWTHIFFSMSNKRKRITMTN
ncbi:plant intracellular Ras-group-related LRR protein 4-like [Bidens hawaiensis]|uniref:plant intracellular Ras-group-related LRR protein 4-like n=1 Tax=Bidens hawaiensis TaxID=980011 RepID=UPI004049BF60